MRIISTCVVLFAIAYASAEKRFLNNYACGITSTIADSIKAQLKIDEGYKTVIYRDSKGYLTFGIGHLITHNDPEYGKPAGTHVSTSRIDSVFQSDVTAAINTFHSIFPHCSSLPREVKEIIVNMAFNLGGGLRNFHNFISAVNSHNWSKAADEMVNSAWYRQVGNRSVRLVARMRAV
ncbi:probable T4-type lysozyme 1 [Ruditapes philippinarum]|uniref:probable T4-type lysozyme 1 n=1 Tax=Ruditapes philippinarum TaxID=129788 RepID=UPI00295B65B7|nr:probable T4-type lysozyme 1 [Ruditapes philippinarum]